MVRYAALNKDKKIGIITPFANQKECIQKMLNERGLRNVTCGTVHAFQGDEKDVILFSLAVTEQTGEKSYEWLKNNKELLNVAVSRAKEQICREHNLITVILSAKGGLFCGKSFIFKLRY